MLEITGDDIAALNDEDLRTLIGRLCEAELRARNLTTSAVTWGGGGAELEGVAFFQHPHSPTSGAIRCHARNSIYKNLLPTKCD